MTPDERDLLTRFLNDLTSVPPASRDDEAAALIDRALARRPDAGYLLVQHAILADQALHAAQARIADLEQQRQAAPERRFLDAAAPSPWGAPSNPASRGIFTGGPPAAPGGFSSFLQSAATTAAGVAAGDFLFEGLSNLFGGRRTGGFLGGGFGGGLGGSPPSVQNIVVNEYNTDPSDDDGDDTSSDFGDTGDDGFNDV